MRSKKRTADFQRAKSQLNQAKEMLILVDGDSPKWPSGEIISRYDIGKIRNYNRKIIKNTPKEY